MNQVAQSRPTLRIDVMANGYMVRNADDMIRDRCTPMSETHVFESFDALVAHLRAYLPIYPVMQPTLTTTAKRPQQSK